MSEDTLSGPAEVRPAKQTRKPRGPMSEAQKEKIRASNKAKRERKAEAPPEAPNVKTGITAAEAEEMRLELQLKLAEEKIKAETISEDNRLMVHQEIQVDAFNRLRRYVELTPSMCRSRNCPFDAAVKAGATGWGDSPINQKMANGETFGDRLIALREYHEATAHTVQQLNDHIITAGELNSRQWSPGQNVNLGVLQGAK